MRRRESGDASFLIGVVLGIFAGGAAALILAPEQGQKTPEQISEEARRAEQGLRDKRTDVQQTLDRLTSDAKDKDKPKDEATKAQEQVARIRGEVTKAQEEAAKSNVRVEEAEQKLQKAKYEAGQEQQKAADKAPEEADKAATSVEGRTRDSQD
jgi:gas vesicle protein